MEIENENTFKKALSEGCNLFLGAGFSVLAKDMEGRPLPTGSEVIVELSETFEVRNVAGLSLSQVCTILEHDRQRQFHNFLKKRFSVGQFDSRYYYLEKLNVKDYLHNQCGRPHIQGVL